MAIIQVTGLQVLSIFCSDLEKTKSFYIDKLGFKEGEEMQPGVLLNAPNLTLYIEAGREPQEKTILSFPEICPCFATDSLKKAYQDLKESGVKIVTEYVEYAPSFGIFRIADPDGNVLEFAGQP